MQIAREDPRHPQVVQLLEEHADDIAATAPRESRHALDVDGLCQPSVTFWTLREGTELLGCGALLELDPTHGEIKGMRTAKAHLRQGVAATLLAHLVEEARRRGYRRLSLETGSMEYFIAAVALYQRFGFQPCGPFADYRDDPNSLFLTREL